MAYAVYAMRCTALRMLVRCEVLTYRMHSAIRGTNVAHAVYAMRSNSSLGPENRTLTERCLGSAWNGGAVGCASAWIPSESLMRLCVSPMRMKYGHPCLVSVSTTHPLRVSDTPWYVHANVHPSLSWCLREYKRGSTQQCIFAYLQHGCDCISLLLPRECKCGDI
eukprot:1014813-Rhodomonas_salina.1